MRGWERAAGKDRQGRAVPSCRVREQKDEEVDSCREEKGNEIENRERKEGRGCGTSLKRVASSLAPRRHLSLVVRTRPNKVEWSSSTWPCRTRRHQSTPT